MRSGRSNIFGSKDKPAITPASNLKSWESDGLTICSVTYLSAPFVWLLHETLQVTSPGVRWVLVQNGPDEVLPAGIDVIPGLDRPTTMGTSEHHALALHLAMAEAKSRYILALDPDFIVVQPLGELLQYVKDKKLAFFGAGYCPRYTRCYANFPAAFCMLIDRGATDVLNMNPSFNSKISTYNVDKPETGIRIFQQYHRTHSSEIVDHVSGHGHDYYEWRGKPFGFHKHMRVEHGKDVLKATNELRLLTRRTLGLDSLPDSPPQGEAIGEQEAL